MMSEVSRQIQPDAPEVDGYNAWALATPPDHLSAPKVDLLSAIWKYVSSLGLLH